LHRTCLFLTQSGHRVPAFHYRQSRSPWRSNSGSCATSQDQLPRRVVRIGALYGHKKRGSYGTGHQYFSNRLSGSNYCDGLCSLDHVQESLVNLSAVPESAFRGEADVLRTSQLNGAVVGWRQTGRLNAAPHQLVSERSKIYEIVTRHSPSARYAWAEAAPCGNHTNLTQLSRRSVSGDVRHAGCQCLCRRSSQPRGHTTRTCVRSSASSALTPRQRSSSSTNSIGRQFHYQNRCPLSEVKRICRFALQMSACTQSGHWPGLNGMRASR